MAFISKIDINGDIYDIRGSQVNSDWNSSSGVSEILNKPTLGTAAAKDYSTTVAESDSDLITSGAVYTAIQNLPEPMVFKGSLGFDGTISFLPVDGSATVGDTYKVITAGTYASQAAKIGDTFICLTKTSNANTWELIPSGDEPSGTVTSVATGVGLTGGPITSSGTIKVDLKSETPLSSAAVLGNSGLVNAVQVDSNGNLAVPGLVGEDVSGHVYVIDGETYTAGPGAEVFNRHDYYSDRSMAIGDYSHAEGNYTTALGDYSHAEGSDTIASGHYSHTEGYNTTASGNTSHAEGYNTTASGDYSHAEGGGTKASSNSSHAEGAQTEASGICSHSEGQGTKASSYCQHVQGQYNIEDPNDRYAFIIGNGDTDNARSNALAIDWNGGIWTGADTTSVQGKIGSLVDRGAKNLLDVRDQTLDYQGILYVAKDGIISASGTATGTPSRASFGSVLLPPGDYVLSGCPANGSDTTYRLDLYASTTDSNYSLYDNKVDRGDGVSFTISTQLYIRPTVRFQNGYIASNFVFKPMICTAVDYEASSEFVPYAPTNRELYEMILALQSGT